MATQVEPVQPTFCWKCEHHKWSPILGGDHLCFSPTDRISYVTGYTEASRCEDKNTHGECADFSPIPEPSHIVIFPEKPISPRRWWQFWKK